MSLIETKEEFGRIRFMGTARATEYPPYEAGYRSPNEKRLVLAAEVSEGEVAEILASGRVDDVTERACSRRA